MKKIYLAALTLAMTACVSNEDLNPVDNYGYIDLNVSNDPIVETRTEINGKYWIVKIGDTEYNDNSQAFNAGTYNVSVKTHEDLSKAIGEGSAWGEAYYDNSSNNNDQITVEAGKTVTKEISCGKAKNTRLTVVFTEQFTNVFPTYQLAVTSPKTLTFNAENNKSTEKYAYFEAEEEITFTITYKKENQESPTTTEEKKLTLGGAGYEKIISVTANSAGNIELNITTDNFETTTGEDITFDAATGTEVITEQTN